MAKSSTRNRTEGTFDKVEGRVREVVGRLTGRPATKAKGKRFRLRGSARKTTGRAKRPRR